MYKKSLLLVAAPLLLSTAQSAVASETLKVDREFAINRSVELDVTPNGVVIDLGSKINSVNLTHMGEITFQGLDGALCKGVEQCPENSSPTMLLLKKIPSINFPQQQNNPDRSSMLYVNTSSGMYRFELTPKSTKPRYTKVEIDFDSVEPLLSNE